MDKSFLEKSLHDEIIVKLNNAINSFNVMIFQNTLSKVELKKSFDSFLLKVRDIYLLDFVALCKIISNRASHMAKFIDRMFDFDRTKCLQAIYLEVQIELQSLFSLEDKKTTYRIN